jgi:hypothetical protein
MSDAFSKKEVFSSMRHCEVGSLTQPSSLERALKCFKVSLFGGDLEGASCWSKEHFNKKGSPVCTGEPFSIKNIFK